MENSHKPEEKLVQDNHDNQKGARHDLQQEALTLFQCKDGSIVNHPLKCKEPKGIAHLEVTPLKFG